MKIFLVVVVLAAVGSKVNAASNGAGIWEICSKTCNGEERNTEAFAFALRECKKELGRSSHSEFWSCLLTKLGVLQGGEINACKYIEVTKEMYPKQGEGIAKHIVLQCRNKNAPYFLKCAKEEWKQLCGPDMGNHRPV